MQTTLLTNCLQANVQDLLNFPEYSTAAHNAHFMADAQQLMLTTDMNIYIQKQFASKRAYIRGGCLSFISYFTALYTLMIGAVPLVYKAFYQRNQYQLEQQAQGGYAPPEQSQASIDAQDAELNQKTMNYEIIVFCLFMPVFSLLY